MFGTLLRVAEIKDPKLRQKVFSTWYEIIRKWYPGCTEKALSVPPCHIRRCLYKKRCEPNTCLCHGSACGSACVSQLGGHLLGEPFLSDMKDDEAQDRVMCTLLRFAEESGMVVFILSNMEFQNFLNKDYDWNQDPNAASPKDYFKPNEEGEVDILVIDKRGEITVLEIKSIGDSDEIRMISERQKIDELNSKLFQTPVSAPTSSKRRKKRKKLLAEQLEQHVDVVEKLVHHNDTRTILGLTRDITINRGFVLPNTTRAVLDKALEALEKSADPQDKTDLGNLLRVLRASSRQEVLDCTLCQDDLPTPEDFLDGRLTQDKLNAVTKTWECMRNLAARNSTKSLAMTDELYEHVVALFCGPLTTVSIYTDRNTPRVTLIPKPGKRANAPQDTVEKMECRTAAGAAREVARRFSEIVLHEDQMNILGKHEDFVHILGAHGTGKTIVLLFRALHLLQKDYFVWILSLAPPSQQISAALMQQVQETLHKHLPALAEVVKSENRLNHVTLITPEATLNAKYYPDMLKSFIKKANGKSVGLVLDETGVNRRGLKSFFKQVCDVRSNSHVPNSSPGPGPISVWSASSERAGCPSYVTPGNGCYELTVPYRCPPSIQWALQLVQPYLDASNVCFFQKGAVLSLNRACQYPAKGEGVKLINHGKHKMPHEEVWECIECAEELASFLSDNLRVGQRPCRCPHKPICYEENPTQSHCPDCEGLTKGHLPTNECPLMCADVIIAPTKAAFVNTATIGDFIKTLKAKGFKVAVMPSHAEGDDPKRADGVMYITDFTSIFGMERAVVVIIPEASSEEEMEISAPADDQPGTSTQVPTSSAAQDASSAAQDAPTVASSTGVCSKDQFEAALKSLSAQSRRDVFDIGSRATYQFVLIHH